MFRKNIILITQIELTVQEFYKQNYDMGIRRYIRFFTKNEMIWLFYNTEYSIDNIIYQYNQPSKEEEVLIERLVSLEAEIDIDNLKVYQ